MSFKETEYIISVGSNLINGKELVANGLAFIESLLSDVRRSEIYTTPSISLGDDSIYYNAVAAGRAAFNQEDMSRLCKKWEFSVGRRHDEKCHEVAGDMDIVVVDGIVVRPMDFARNYFKIGFEQIGMASTSCDPED